MNETENIKYQTDVSPELAPYWHAERYVPCTYPPNLLIWMRSDNQVIDLGVDPKVVYKSEYFPVYVDALTDIPTLRAGVRIL